MNSCFFIAGRVYADNEDHAHDIILQKIVDRGFSVVGTVKIKTVPVQTKPETWYEWRAEISKT